MPEVKSDPIFQRAKFSAFVGDIKNLPKDGLPQIVLAGKSNAGKSSLINKLCRQSKLARTSREAGKTRGLIFFDVAGCFYLVDLPGYGFSRSSKEEQKAFSRLTDVYLRSGQPIALILHLLDARHLPSQLDLEMIRWMEVTQAPYLLLLNKSDKLSRAQQAKSRQEIGRAVKEAVGKELPLLSVSALTGQGLDDLSRQILERLKLRAYEE